MKRIFLLLFTLNLLLAASCQSHRYALPSPKGPPQPKVKKSDSQEQNADGTSATAAPPDVKIQKNSYDKNGLLKKPKYERRRLKKKVGQRKFLGITLPF